MSRSRLTRSGSALVAGAVGLVIAGLLAGYRELLILALVAAMAVVAALLAPRTRSRVQLRRRVSRKLVQRGDELEVALRVRAPVTLVGLRVVDRLDDREIPVGIAHLERGRGVEARYRIRPRERGVRRIGPIGEERSDPLGLAIRRVEHDVIDEVLVHPVVHTLAATTSGAVIRQQALSRKRISDDPVSDFRSLRLYVPGDDPRRIHWASSARVGQPVVRDFLEQRHTLRLVLLETLESTITASGFEEAVEIAASLAIDAWDRGLASITRTRDPGALGSASPIRDRNDVLIQLARVNRTSEAETAEVNRVLQALPTIDQVYCVTGPDSPLLRSLVGSPRYRPYLTAVQVAGEGPIQRVPVTTMRVRSAEEFSSRWRAGRIA